MTQRILIRGDKILLRAMELRDIDLLYEWENNTDYWRASQTLVPFSRESLKNFVEEGIDIMAHRQVRWMIETLDRSDTIGTADLFDCDFINRRAGVGILIGKKEARKKGFAGEAINLLEHYARKSLNLHQLYCHISEENVESIKLFESLGYSKSGVLTDWIYTPHQYIDQHIYQKKLG